jgi:hypothetical protein
MVKFGAQNLKEAKAGVNLDILDVGIVLLFLMLTFLVSANWNAPSDASAVKSIGLNVTMLALSVFALIIYFIGALTRSFSSLKLVSPMWVVGAVVAFPVWILYSFFIPIASSTGQVLTQVSSANVLGTVFGQATFDFIQAVFVYGVIESLVLGILLVFFLGISQKTKGSPMLLPAFIVVVLFMGLLHGSVALTMDTSGSLDFTAIILHQVVAFSIMGIGFLFLGMSGNIALHQVKNALALNASVFMWILLFAFFALLTFLALRKGGASAKAQLNATIKGLGV